MTRLRWLAMAPLVLLLACSSGNGDEDGPTATNQPAVSPMVEATPWPTATSAGTPATADAAELDSSTSLPGQYVAPHPGADGQRGNEDDYVHLPEGATLPICSAEQLAAGNLSNPVCYQSNPPTSGPHAPAPVRYQFYTQPIAKEALVHNMEHGGVVIWYNTTNQNVINTIRTITDGSTGSRYPVSASPYPGMEPETIALTSWTRLDKFPAGSFDAARVLDFIFKHSRRFNPEGF